MPSSADKVLQYLEEIHALETHLVSTLTAHIAMTPRSEYRDLLERHRYETRRQVQRIEQRRTELGRSSSLLHVVYGTAQDVVGQGISLLLAPLNLFRGTGGEEKLLKNAKDEAASEALEIASYDALEAVAEAVGDAKTGVLAREHRTQEETFLKDLRELIPGLATDVVDAEVDGQPHYDPMTTGAADAVRKVTRKAKATTGRVRGATAGTEDEIAIAGYDRLTVEQLLPKLKTLSPEELAAVAGYERGGRSRRRVLDRIAALRSKKVDEQLAKL
jgi:ferritin-like metal-binding protein YciE